ncbi:MAG: EpsG family protein [Oscillospiraceae bacterium]|nr:EpsG family protein [Oscillospiraceae bacterium]
MYYAISIALTLILCKKFSTTYSMLDYPEARRFKNFRTAFFVLLPLTFVAATRWNVGVDSLYYGSYWTAYQEAAKNNNYREFELLFFWFMQIFSSLKVPYFWFLFVHSLIFMACVSYALYKGSIWTAWSILTFFMLFVYFDCYSSLRQSIAEGICLIAWAKMGADKKSLKKEIQILSLFLLSTLFHSIALINIPIYFICKMRLPKNNYVLFLIFAILLTPAIQVVMKSIMVLIAGSSYEFKGLALINTIMTGVICFICWLFYDQILNLNRNAHVYLNYAACIFILILNSGAMFLPFRVFDMLKIGYVFIIPYILRSMSKRWNKVCMTSLFAIIFGAWFINAFFLQNSFASQYQSALEDWSTITNLP